MILSQSVHGLGPAAMATPQGNVQVNLGRDAFLLMSISEARALSRQLSRCASDAERILDARGELHEAPATATGD